MPCWRRGPGCRGPLREASEGGAAPAAVGPQMHEMPVHLSVCHAGDAALDALFGLQMRAVLLSMEPDDHAAFRRLSKQRPPSWKTSRSRRQLQDAPCATSASSTAGGAAVGQEPEPCEARSAVQGSTTPPADGAGIDGSMGPGVTSGGTGGGREEVEGLSGGCGESGNGVVESLSGGGGDGGSRPVAAGTVVGGEWGNGLAGEPVSVGAASPKALPRDLPSGPAEAGASSQPIRDDGLQGGNEVASRCTTEPAAVGEMDGLQGGNEEMDGFAEWPSGDAEAVVAAPTEMLACRVDLCVSLAIPPPYNVVPVPLLSYAGRACAVSVCAAAELRRWNQATSACLSLSRPVNGINPKPYSVP
jgi:hypothetical protein